MPNEYLDFEEPIAVLERKILDLQSSELDENRDLTKEINKLNDSIVKLTDKVYQNLTIWPVSYTHLTLPTIYSV